MEGLLSASLRFTLRAAFGCLKSLQAILSNRGSHHTFMSSK